MAEQDTKYIKICLLGSQKVGKSYLAHKLVGKDSIDLMPTQERQHLVKQVNDKIALLYHDYPPMQSTLMDELPSNGDFYDVMILLFKDSASFAQLYEFLEDVSRRTDDNIEEFNRYWESIRHMVLVFSDEFEQKQVQTEQLFTILSEEIRNFNRKGTIHQFVLKKDVNHQRLQQLIEERLLSQDIHKVEKTQEVHEEMKVQVKEQKKNGFKAESEEQSKEVIEPSKQDNQSISDQGVERNKEQNSESDDLDRQANSDYSDVDGDNNSQEEQDKGTIPQQIENQAKIEEISVNKNENLQKIDQQEHKGQQREYLKKEDQCVQERVVLVEDHEIQVEEKIEAIETLPAHQPQKIQQLKEPTQEKGQQVNPTQLKEVEQVREIKENIEIKQEQENNQIKEEAIKNEEPGEHYQKVYNRIMHKINNEPKLQKKASYQNLFEEFRRSSTSSGKASKELEEYWEEKVKKLEEEQGEQSDSEPNKESEYKRDQQEEEQEQKEEDVQLKTQRHPNTLSTDPIHPHGQPLSAPAGYLKGSKPKKEKREVDTKPCLCTVM